MKAPVSPYQGIADRAAKKVLADVVGMGAPDPKTYRRSEHAWLAADELEYARDVRGIAKIILRAIETAAKKKVR